LLLTAKRRLGAEVATVDNHEVGWRR
jgi:hypothetical protein